MILQKGKRNKGAQSKIGNAVNQTGDDGGHLIGTQFNGSGNIDNLVPQNSKVNQSGGEWYKMESEWAKALEEGKTVQADIVPNYSGDSFRPDSITVNYTIDGKAYTKVVDNP